MQDWSILRKILLVAGLALLLGLAVLGPVQLLGGFHLHALLPADAAKAHPALENWGANLALFRAINGHPSPPLDLLFTVCWYLGNGWVLVPVLLIVIACRPAKVKYFLVTVAIETVLVQALKHLADQPRPVLWLEGVRVSHAYFSHSFPSGDAALAFAIACSLLPGESRKWQALLLAYAALVALERVYMGVHFPLDVTAGALVGALPAWGVWRLWRKATPAPAPPAPASCETSAGTTSGGY
jgi:membrane-associated phospholipid phosphatase